jgi:hypothetical protein
MKKAANWADWHGRRPLDEPQTIKILFDELMLEPLQRFPGLGERLSAPTQPGIYVLYGAKGKVCYVGLARGLRSRIMTHLRSSWHEAKYGRDFKSRGGFRCLIVENERQRALLETYATGCLCPAYIGNIGPTGP